MIELKTETRESKENNVKLRKDGYIPAVFYGAKEESTPIKMKESDFTSVYKSAGESTIINIKEGSNDHEALIHDVQYDAVSGDPIHVDFYVIEKGKKLEVSVPLNFVGESPAEKELGGVLVKVIHELEISALPKDLPSEIEVDISSLVDFSSQIRAGEINLPEGVELVVPAEEVVALVQEPKEEEEPEPVEGDLDSIEVEGEKKEGEEGAEGEGGESKEGGEAKPNEGGEKSGE